MIWNPQQIESAALELPLHERARLTERLIASLDRDVSVEDAWAIEIERRVEAYRDGTLAALDGDAVIAEARARLKSG
ncbi:MAG TPA: addiction module protein [Longimicrobiaceae bacterium]|nr:addiction module protein [Longimicrobiaceae bacterium]